jgi:hypothetical protein
MRRWQRIAGMERQKRYFSVRVWEMELMRSSVGGRMRRRRR